MCWTLLIAITTVMAVQNLVPEQVYDEGATTNGCTSHLRRKKCTVAAVHSANLSQWYMNENYNAANTPDLRMLAITCTRKCVQMHSPPFLHVTIVLDSCHISHRHK
jgi:hypothetical protein